MAEFGFEYFCGANVIVKVGNFPVLEAAGLSYSISESKRPIYGYSSRFFDAVARGQVLVQGSLVVNHVHKDYLYRLIRISENPNEVIEPVKPVAAIQEQYMQSNLESMVQDYPGNLSFAEAMKEIYWDFSTEDAQQLEVHDTSNAHDNSTGIDIRIVFGEQSENNPNGKTGTLLKDVYFIGSSQSIQIDEETIVEVFNFIARDIYSLKRKITATVTRGRAEADEGVLTGE